MHGLTRELDDRNEAARLRDELEQTRTALEAAQEEVSRLAEDRDRLLRRVTDHSRDLQTANASYEQALGAGGSEVSRIAAVSEHEELRVAFEEMQVLTEELEVANNSLLEANRALDRRVADRTRELASKNAALADSEARFRTLFEGMPQLVWRAVDGGRWTWAGPQWMSYTGLYEADSLDFGWLAALHPDDRATAQDAWQRAEAKRALEFEARIYHRAEDRYRHFKVRASIAPAADGRGMEWLGTSTDVDDLLRLQERQQLLVAELQHRVRNILTVIRSVFERTMEAGGGAEELADHFRGRLDSLARTQVVVTRSATGLVDLEELIRDELLSVGASESDKLIIAGPEVALPPKAAESIGLAIHELTTNALKYGALRISNGKLRIEWSVNSCEREGRRLVLRWVEEGVPAIPLKPAREGFGTELIREALPYRLGAETCLEIRGGGVRCSIAVPLPDGGEIATPAWRM
jgi:PAS domain S-box-containing protein